jgi:hypothetical protein
MCGSLKFVTSSWAGRGPCFPPILWSALLTIVAGLALFSQTWAWFVDEGFHLLASQLINSGKKPYLDFFYPQTPLWAYINAAWMRVFGDTWRSSHLLSALLTGGSIILTAEFVFQHVPEKTWNLRAALIATILIGLNTLIIQFGTVGHAYAICLFLNVASFRLATKAAAKSSASLVFWCGLCAGASAESSLLSTPVLPILLAWTVWRSVSGERVKTFIWFLVGAGIAFLPLAYLATLAPRQVFFNTFEYHFFHRHPESAATLHNLKTLYRLLDSSQFLLLIIFAGIGLLFVLGNSQWKAERKAEFYLCGYVVAGLGIFLTTLRFTYIPYFILLIPFLTILASIGIMATATWLGQSGRPAWLVPGVLALYLSGLPRWVWHESGMVHWSHMEEVAKVVNDVTPEGAWIWAHESIYFASRRIPPPGLEHRDSHKLRLSPAASASLHVVSYADLNDWIGAGRFATVVVCFGRADTSGMPKLYAQHAKVAECDIFWSKSAQN